MIARLFKIVVGVAVLVGVGLCAWLLLAPGPMAFAGGKPVTLADYKGANPTGLPAELAGASVRARGEYLARAADCEGCHTAKGGTPFAGGLGFVLPVGTIYSTNITPDQATGIGGYSDAEFLAAMRHGIRRDGARLYPAMPFATYALMTDADALAIKAFLSGMASVRAPARANTLAWPFDQRPLVAIWDWMFNPAKPFAPNPQRSAVWNRGAYLAEALAHCGECHTPRNIGMALDHRNKFAGAMTGGWRAFNITPDGDTGVGSWSDAALASYLSTGFASGHGIASGPMGEAVDLGLSHLTPGDIRALVAYLRSVPARTADVPVRVLEPAPQSYKAGVAAGAGGQGQKIFAGVCAGCHGWTGKSPVTPYATLTGIRSVNDPGASNVAQAVLFGVHRAGPKGAPAMPAFGGAYSDREVAAVVNYVTGRFGAKAARLSESQVARLRSLAAP